MKFIQDSKNNTVNLWEDTIMVLRYPGHCFKQNEDDAYFSKEFDRQKSVLEYRFPPKFLWMWANKEIVLHPISLMAFRNFLTNLDNEFQKNVLDNKTPESITNMKFDDFTEAWKNISDKILKSIVADYDKKNDDEQKEIIKNLSKLISLISIEETDIKNISDLLQTGNQAVILWGPPGTGKTYESEAVVKELLEVDEDVELEEKYLFSKGHLNRNQKGYYEIVQFHPNYTYQDFIGGISPDIEGKKS